ncbi:hypothetical protein MR626_01630 [bacterium]|nr:hypothetical protein [bacterium]
MALGRGKKRYSIDSETFELNEQLKSQDEQLESIKNAEKKYELDGNIDSLIKFWEDIWNNGGLLFRGSAWTFRLPDLYIKQKRYDDALSILRKIRNPSYRDKKASYIERIEKLKQKDAKTKNG